MSNPRLMNDQLPDPIIGNISMTSEKLNPIVKTADYTATVNDCVIVCNKATPMTVTLPTATGSGLVLHISSIGLGAVILDGNGSETVDNELFQTLRQWDSVQLVDYASGKWVVV